MVQEETHVMCQTSNIEYKNLYRMYTSEHSWTQGNRGEQIITYGLNADCYIVWILMWPVISVSFQLHNEDVYGNVNFWIIVNMFATVIYFTYSWTWKYRVGPSWDYFLFARAPVSFSMLGLNVLLLIFLLFWYVYKLSFSMNNWWLCNSLKS